MFTEFRFCFDFATTANMDSLNTLSLATTLQWVTHCIVLEGGIWMAPSSLLPYPGVSLQIFRGESFFKNYTKRKLPLYHTIFAQLILYDLLLACLVRDIHNSKHTPKRINPPRTRRGFDTDPGSSPVQKDAAERREASLVGQHLWKRA